MTSERQQFFLLREDLLRPEHPSARCRTGCKSTNPGRSPGFELRSFKLASNGDTSENAIYTVARPRGNLTRFPILPASAQGTRTKSKRVALGSPNLTCQQQTRQSFASVPNHKSTPMKQPGSWFYAIDLLLDKHAFLSPSPFPFSQIFGGAFYLYPVSPYHAVSLQ
jgi:hypothetical protein